MSKRVSFSSDGNENLQPTMSNKVVEGKRKSVIIGVWSIRPSSKISGGFTPGRSFLKRVRAKVARAMSFISIKRSSRKVSSSSGANLVRSRSYAEPLDQAHRAEVIGDCIEFLNSSSCNFKKSKSIS